jgi:hypothetical protein
MLRRGGSQGLFAERGHVGEGGEDTATYFATVLAAKKAKLEEDEKYAALRNSDKNTEEVPL